jgi:hypothetical protein
VPDPDVLERVEAYLRNNASGIISFARGVDLEEVADLLLAIRLDQAMVVYPCSVHNTPRECNKENLLAFLRFTRTSLLFTHEAMVDEYLKVAHPYEGCHS